MNMTNLLRDVTRSWRALATSCATHYVIMLPLILSALIHTASSIGCFVCSSTNGSEPGCEDTFNNTGRFYQQHCMAGRPGRAGLFPGTACVKMTAQLKDDRVIVRTCAVDAGGTNSETELGRESHCWMVTEVRYNDKKMKGCSVACDTDGCNASTVPRSSSGLLGLMVVGLLVMLFGQEM